MNQVKTIIFDLGGVVISSFGKEFKAYASKTLGVKEEDLRSLVNIGEPLLQRGKVTPVEFWNAVVTAGKRQGLIPQDRRFSDEELRKIWTEPYKTTKVYQEVVNLIQLLREKFGYRVAAFSNIMVDHAEYNEKRGINELFDALYYSFEMGQRKVEIDRQQPVEVTQAAILDQEEPIKVDIRAYRKVQEGEGVGTDELAFIDDSKLNLEAAHAAGWKHLILHKEGDTTGLVDQLSEHLGWEPEVTGEVKAELGLSRIRNIERQ